MKILHILSQIPEATGSGIYLQALLRHAALHGYQNYLLAGIPADYPEIKQFAKLACQDHSVIRFDQDLPFSIVGMSDVMPYPSARFCDLSTFELQLYEQCFADKLGEAVERWQPDLIHSHHLWLLTSLARQRFPEIPMLVSCHGSDLRQFLNCPHLQPAVLNGCQKIDAVCALSETQKADIRQLYGISRDRIHTVGAGYDRKIFYPPLVKSEGPLQIIYAGKLSRAKGVPWLLRALSLLAEEEFLFHLVGDSDGAEKAEILQWSERLGPRICVHGKLEQQPLADLMRQADLFVLPSFFEGLPLVLLEALACDCRLIATALPGVKELFAGINSDWVELVPLPRMATLDRPSPGGEETFVLALQTALLKQICRLKQNKQQEFPRELKGLLKKNTWAGIFVKIEQLYQQLLGK